MGRALEGFPRVLRGINHRFRRHVCCPCGSTSGACPISDPPTTAQQCGSLFSAGALPLPAEQTPHSREGTGTAWCFPSSLVRFISTRQPGAIPARHRGLLRETPSCTLQLPGMAVDGLDLAHQQCLFRLNTLNVSAGGALTGGRHGARAHAVNHRIVLFCYMGADVQQQPSARQMKEGACPVGGPWGCRTVAGDDSEGDSPPIKVKMKVRIDTRRRPPPRCQGQG